MAKLGSWAAWCVVVVWVAAAGAQEANMLGNGDFEAGGRSTVVGWGTHIARGEYAFTVSPEAHAGTRCVAITAEEGLSEGWSRWYTTDLFVVKGSRYRFSVWARASEDAGGDVCVIGSGGGVTLPVAGPTDWQELSGEFTATATGRTGVYLQSMRGGTIWFDDASLTLVEPAPPEPGTPVQTDGLPLDAIVIPDAAGPHHGYLALEVQRILTAMVGSAPPVVPASAAPAGTDGRRLFIGVIPPGRSYAAQLAEVGDEGIVLDIGPEAVVCLGNTPRGVYYAVHELLHTLGCRWCWPGPLGEVIPKVERLELAPMLVAHAPDFTLRGGTMVQVYHDPVTGEAGHIDTESWVDWAARNRINRLKAGYATTWDYGATRGGGQDEVAGHSLYAILDPAKYFANHPEYYPLVRGERTATHSSGRPAQVCTSNPEVIALVADYACDYFASHPLAKRFAVCAEDEPSYWCECDACKALDIEPVDWSQNGVDVMPLTDRWLHFVNAIAEKVEREYPDKWVVTFAYASSRELPRRERPRRNVMIELTWWDECFKHRIEDPNCAINAKGMERLHGWSRLAPLALYRYLDYHHCESPAPYFHAEADLLRVAHAAGVRNLADEWDTTFAASSLLLNLRARLEWDLSTDVDAFITDWCQRVYGPAGGAMERYYRRLEQAVEESPGDHVVFNDLSKFTPEVLRDCQSLLDEATAAAAGSDDIAGRIDRQRYSLLYAEFDQISEAATDDLALLQRKETLRAKLWDLVQRRHIAPVLDYWHRLTGEYQPPVAALTGRRVVELPETWQFRTDPDNTGEAQGWASAAPDADWRPISTHKAWEEQGVEGYDGYAWYTVEVDIPAIPGPHVWLLCEAVDETFELWINGERVGASEGDPGLLWDKPVAVEITGRFRPGEANRITMRVHDQTWAGGIWKPVWIVGSE